MLLVCAVPSVASAGPLLDAFERAARTTALAQQPEPVRDRSGRFWTGIALLAGGGLLIALGALEVGDDEEGGGADDDDGEDDDASDDGEDGDGAHKAMLGGGIAAAAVGGVLLLTGRNAGSPQRTGVVVRHTLRF
jgi:hypothetical protein